MVRLQPTLGRAASAGGAAPHVTEALLENVTMEQIARVLVSMADQRLRATHLRLTASRQRQTPERWRIELTTVTGPSGASGEARP